MSTIIGLGAQGCDIAEVFETNRDYNVKLLDINIEGENCFSFKVHNSSEEYEKNTPDLSDFFSDIHEQVFFIVDGSTKIAGASLQILKQLKDKKINLIYVRQDVNLLGNIAKMQDRVAFNVLQEYARSGIFNSISLISLSALDNIIGDMPILEYNENINKLIYNTIVNIEKFNNEEPIIDNFSSPKDVSKIITYGIYDIANNLEKLFYPLDLIDDKCYYFGINENDLKTNSKLFRVIKDRMREKTVDKTKISYRIHSTGHEMNFCYVIAYSKKIQQ